MCTTGPVWGREAGRGAFPNGASQTARVSIPKHPKTSQAAQEQQERTAEALPQPCHQAQGAQERCQPRAKRLPGRGLSVTAPSAPQPCNVPNCQGGARAATARLGLPSPSVPKSDRQRFPRCCDSPAVRPMPGLSAVPNNHTNHSKGGGNKNSLVFSVKQQTEPRHLSLEPGMSHDQQPGPGSPASPSHCNQPSPKIINSRLFLHLLARKTALISCFVRLYHASTILAWKQEAVWEAECLHLCTVPSTARPPAPGMARLQTAPGSRMHPQNTES